MDEGKGIPHDRIKERLKMVTYEYRPSKEFWRFMLKVTKDPTYQHETLPASKFAAYAQEDLGLLHLSTALGRHADWEKEELKRELQNVVDRKEDSYSGFQDDWRTQYFQVFLLISDIHNIMGTLSSTVNFDEINPLYDDKKDLSYSRY